MSVALARPMPFDTSPGQLGGILAGIVGVLVAIGHGVKWAINHGDRRAVARTAKLDAWEARLDARETGFEAKIEARMEAVERENRGLRMAFQHVYVALHRHAPEDPALALAERILAQSIPLDPFTPPDMASKLDKMP